MFYSASKESIVLKQQVIEVYLQVLELSKLVKNKDQRRFTILLQEVQTLKDDYIPKSYLFKNVHIMQ